MPSSVEVARHAHSHIRSRVMREGRVTLVLSQPNARISLANDITTPGANAAILNNRSENIQENVSGRNRFPPEYESRGLLFNPTFVIE
jgi:hypothetical protein